MILGIFENRGRFLQFNWRHLFESGLFSGLISGNWQIKTFFIPMNFDMMWVPLAFVDVVYEGCEIYLNCVQCLI